MEIDKKAAGQRLKLFLDSRFKSANEAGAALGTSGDSLRNSYFNGQSLPGARLLGQLNLMGCSIDWLLFGDQNVGKYTIKENKERSLCFSSRRWVMFSIERGPSLNCFCFFPSGERSFSEA